MHSGWEGSGKAPPTVSSPPTVSHPLLRRTAHLEQVRLVSQRTDLSRWDADERDLGEAIGWRRPYPRGLSPVEGWLPAVFDLWAKANLPPTATLTLPPLPQGVGGVGGFGDFFGGGEAVAELLLVVLAPAPVVKGAGKGAKQGLPQMERLCRTIVVRGCGLIEVGATRFISAVCIFATPPTHPPTLSPNPTSPTHTPIPYPFPPQAYELVSVGRSLHRRLVFTSDATQSLHEPPPESLQWFPAAPAPSPQRGAVLAPQPPPSPSLRVSRNASTAPHLAQQTLVPSRLLRGLLPDTLLDAYVFWQTDGGTQSLHGFETDETAASAVTHRRVLVELLLLGEGCGGGEGDRGVGEGAVAREGSGESAVVREGAMEGASADGAAGGAGGLAGSRRNARVSLLSLVDATPGQPPSEAAEDVSTPRLVLAHPRSAAAAPLAALFTRMEGCAHTLFWCEGRREGGGGVAPSPLTLTRVELPRLRLGFSLRGGRLLSDEHPGFWVSDTRGGALEELLVGLCAHSLLLEDATGELRLLLPAAGRPLPVAQVMNR